MTKKLSNIDIAQAAKMRRIAEVAQERLGIPEDALEAYGKYKAKVSLDYLSKLKRDRVMTKFKKAAKREAGA